MIIWKAGTAQAKVVVRTGIQTWARDSQSICTAVTTLSAQDLSSSSY